MRRRPGPWGCLVRLAVAASLLCGLAGVGAVAGVFWVFGRDLPEIRDVQDYRPKQATRLYAPTGEVLATLVDDGAQQRTVVPFDDIPVVMRHAMLAAEDAGFYEHQGLDYLGLIRAVVTNLRRGALTQGASTITQQLVKNLVLTPERTIRRKVQEAILAYRLEDRLTKDEILGIYLNHVFFGSRAYGVEEAARYYFGHGIGEVDLSEAATLAGLVQSPNRYNPHFHPTEARARRGYVLRQMWEKGFIDEASYREAEAEPLRLDPARGVGPLEGRFGAYVDAAQRALVEALGPERVFGGGLQVVLAIDVAAQTAAEEAVQAGLRDYDRRHGYHTPRRTLADDAAVEAWREDAARRVSREGLSSGDPFEAVVLEANDAHVRLGVGAYVVELERSPITRVRPEDAPWDELFPARAVLSFRTASALTPAQLADDTVDLVAMPSSAEAALVAIEPRTRRVVAIVGGYESGAGGFNRAVQARRQVGSAFKPIVYAAALERREATPATIFLDQPETFPLSGDRTWRPQNYDGAYLGPMTMRMALARSRNVIAVRVLAVVGLRPVNDLSQRLGITSVLTDNLTLALGSAELPPLEVTNAFATFAAGGLRGAPVLIQEVRDVDRAVIYRADAALEQTVDPALAWLTTSMMESVVQSGTGTAARRLPFAVAGKTGTTNGARDAWFVGYSTALVTGVWVGRDDNEELGRGETGGHSALPIWIGFMARAHEGREVAGFSPPPPGIEAREIDPETGLLAPEGRRSVTEYFLTGTAPTAYAPSRVDRSVTDVLLGGPETEGSGAVGEPPVDDGF